MDNKKRLITLIVFLLGIFLGAMDSGIVSPSRTIIQNGFNVTASAGVWMITIYTLAFAVSMPIVSKLSDRYGRKKVYLISILIFTLGSVLCGLTNFFGNYPMFLTARVIQAIGGGGIIPIATAFIGNSFPPEKRGTALGLVGGIYGIATMLGPTIGSFILDIAGASHWGWIFFINAPIGALILMLGVSLPENVGEIKHKLDILGSVAISVVILSLMYALTNIDFFNFINSIKSTNVFPYLIVFLLSLPAFIYIESKAKDPILNIKFFENSQITISLGLAFLTGCGLMGVIFVPQFAENVLKLPSGKGGYIVTLMSLFAGISAPLGGKIIDKLSAKVVILIGFLCTALGTGFLSFYVTSHPSFMGILFGLIFIGFGMGFSMGTPLNYLILNNVSESEASSGLSTLSLVRSIGVTVSPNVMIGFLAQAGKNVQTQLFTQVQDLAPKIPNMTMPANTNMNGNLPTEILDKLKGADVTNIVANLKDFISYLLDNTILPQVKIAMAAAMKGAAAMGGKIPNVDALLATYKNDYLNTIENNRAVLEGIFQSTINSGFKNVFFTACLLALVGVIGSLFLKKKEKT